MVLDFSKTGDDTKTFPKIRDLIEDRIAEIENDIYLLKVKLREFKEALAEIENDTLI